MRILRNLMGCLLVASMMTFVACNMTTPVRLPEIPLTEVEPYFSEAAEVQAIDTSYYQVKDAEGQVLGTVLYSLPFTATVNGYNGPTPLLIALDAEDHIKSVVMLENHETPRFAQRVVDAGMFQTWDGLSVEEAVNKPVDAVSGATYTSNGVKSSLVLRLQVYQRQLTQERDVQPNFWTKLFGTRR